MSRDDAAYFLARAEAELTSAHRADNPAAAKAHLGLARLYRERVRTEGIRDALSEPAGQNAA